VTLSSEEYWEQRATELSRTSLDTVRTSATAWAATTTALLGVFGTVAVIKGPDSIAKLKGTSQTVVTVLIVAASVLAFVSVLATARASRGPAKRFTPLNGLKLKKWTRDNASDAHRDLTIGRVTGVLAALLVLAAGIVGTVAEARTQTTPSGASFLVRTTDGALQCGVLGRSGTGLELVDGSGTKLLDLSSEVAEVTAVTSCPKPVAK
jgi:hypothetical protein